MLDVARIREDFPILRQTIRGKPLVFLDSAASAQKPRAVIDAMREAMETQYANVHRGLHWMSERTTDAYEAARDAVAALLNARDRHEIVFTRNITESLNLMAHSYGRGVLKPGQAVVISGHGAPLQHRALAVAARRPRHRAARRADHRCRRARHGRRSRRCWPTASVGLVSMTHMSNVLGTYTPAERIVRIAHAHGAKVLFDGAQAVVHRRGRRAGAGLRLLRLHRPQAVWPDRHRRAVGPARAAGRDAAVPRRRRDDLLGDRTSGPPGPRCRTSSRPARRRSWKASG